jgi:hypothetical protein
VVLWDLNGRASKDWKSFKYPVRGAAPVKK